MSRIIGVIPARWASTRFPGKPLAKINNLEMLAWVIRGSKKSQQLDELLVATDDERIAVVAQREGLRAILTDSNLPSGSDRIWAAVANEKADIVLNIQGDEPLMTGSLIDQLALPMRQDPHLMMGTLAHSISYEELFSENAVKVLVNEKSEAIYFSRFPIPYSRQEVSRKEPLPAVLKHIGMYAYRKDFLKKYCEHPPVAIEVAECLEQLRALYLGARLKVVVTEERSWGVDTPEDLAKIEEMLGARR